MFMAGTVRKYLLGYLKIVVSGYSSERFMNLCSHQNIELWDVNTVDQAYEMKIYADDFFKLKPMIRKTGTKVKIMKKYGFPFWLRSYLSRYFLIFGFFFCLLFLFFMSTFIWKIEVQGNHRCSDEEIRSFLKSMDVYEGTAKKKISCEAIGTVLRENFEDMIWVSVSLNGVDLVIEVKENTDREYEEKEETDIPIDVVAEKAGRITSIVTSRGTPLVKSGDVVEKGDVLVSGIVEIQDDALEVIGYQYCAAEAEVYAQVEISYQDEVEHTYEMLERTGRRHIQLWIETGSAIWKMGRGTKGYSCYQIESEQKRIKVAEIVPLPWIFGISRVYECTQITSVYTEKEIQEILSENFQRFCQDLEKKGVQILKNDVKIYPGTECTSARGIFTLAEEIGKMKTGTIREINEEKEGNI